MSQDNLTKELKTRMGYIEYSHQSCEGCKNCAITADYEYVCILIPIDNFRVNPTRGRCNHFTAEDIKPCLPKD
jgi:Fe-S-cluster-containing dehydrogenase component